MLSEYIDFADVSNTPAAKDMAQPASTGLITIRTCQRGFPLFGLEQGVEPQLEGGGEGAEVLAWAWSVGLLQIGPASAALAFAVGVFAVLVLVDCTCVDPAFAGLAFDGRGFVGDEPAFAAQASVGRVYTVHALVGHASVVPASAALAFVCHASVVPASAVAAVELSVNTSEVG